jgi:very-short-patch-repair endonuclease
MCELIDRRPIVPVHITIAGANRGRRPGILVHRVAYLEPHEVTMLDGIPITAQMRTLVDLAGTVRHRELERAVGRAEDQHLVSRSALLTQMEAYRRRRGTGMLRRILESQNTPVLTRSEAEERFLLLIRKAGLPTPEANTDVADHEVDFLWRRQRLVVEVDGFAYHSSPGRFESDRRRDADLAAIGYRVLRVTWRQMLNEPEKVLVRLAQTLAISIGPPRS